MDIIRVQNLTKTYGNFTAVNNISFSVEKGTMLGFLGINGAGKTTVINMLATLLAPDSGHVEICGEELGKDDERIRRKIGIVYQQNCLDDILSVQENLICRGIIHGASRAQARGQCARLAEILKLGDIMKKKYRMLSGGQKRRCEIAAALMHTPEILFLDEPTTGLDPATRMDVWNIISRLQKDEKMAVFLTTHYMEEAAGADQIIILDRGNIVTQETPFALKEKFARDKLRLFYRAEKEPGLLAELAGSGLMLPREAEKRMPQETKARTPQESQKAEARTPQKGREEAARTLQEGREEAARTPQEGREEPAQIPQESQRKCRGAAHGTGTGDAGILELAVASTMAALPVIEQVKPFIDGFEVIQGNMDDVFLNAVGRKLAQEGGND